MLFWCWGRGGVLIRGRYIVSIKLCPDSLSQLLAGARMFVCCPSALLMAGIRRPKPHFWMAFVPLSVFVTVPRQTKRTERGHGAGSPASRLYGEKLSVISPFVSYLGDSKCPSIQPPRLSSADSSIVV